MKARDLMIGDWVYRPDYRMTDEEEHELVESLRNKE